MTSGPSPTPSLSSGTVEEPAGHPARLVRSREDRVIAGVAGGLGRFLGIDPVIVRLVLVVLALAGGGGILAYVVAWIVIPEAPVGAEPDPVAVGSAPATVAGVALVALGGLLLIEIIVPGFSWRFVGPALLIGLGILLLVRKGGQR